MTFTPQDLIGISLMNTREDNPNHLSTLELIQLKVGEGVSLSTVTKAKALLEEYKAATAAAKAEDGSLRKEVTNLSSRMMLIYMLLVRKGILGETEIYDLADELERESEEGFNVKPTSEAGRPSRTRSKRKEVKEPTPSVYTARPPGARSGGSKRPSPRATKTGAANARGGGKSPA